MIAFPKLNTQQIGKLGELLVQYRLLLIGVESAHLTTDADSTVITDLIPPNTALYVNDIGGANSGPVLFTQGGTSSTLTYAFTALNDGADDVSFSNNGGATCVATPVAGANGCDPAINAIRINPKGTFIGNTPSPSFQLRFRVCAIIDH